MKIIAVTQDQLIIKNGVAALIRTIGGYNMTRGEWAVHFDTDLGIGEIEYIDNRANKMLTQADYDAHYAWLSEKHQEYIDYLAEQQANEQQSENPDSSSDGSNAAAV